MLHRRAAGASTAQGPAQRPGGGDDGGRCLPFDSVHARSLSRRSPVECAVGRRPSHICLMRVFEGCTDDPAPLSSRICFRPREFECSITYCREILGLRRELIILREPRRPLDCIWECLILGICEPGVEVRTRLRERYSKRPAHAGDAGNARRRECLATSTMSGVHRQRRPSTSAKDMMS